MPINYSKWDKLDVSDDEDDGPVKPKAKSAPKPPAQKPSPPKEAVGSAWNASNYHWEEQKLDDWGKARLRELLTATPFEEEISWNDTRLSSVVSFSVTELEGEAWTHIRKGKSVLGYNFEVKLGFVGKVQSAGGREEDTSGDLEADIMVDNDPEIRCELRSGGELPFKKELQKSIKASFDRVLAQFIAELDEKARSQKQKAEASPDAAAAAAAAPAIPVVSDVLPKSHFGGRVQVGGHNPEGLRIN